ncbi:MAG TPA: hypothetical protein VMU21_02645, partial [Thermodesulfovibrionales bacterium]|nr:hypothetical protein [Thermodesulfovibrionales bacterium]
DWVLIISWTVFSAIVISAFFVADRTGFKIRRYALIDYVIKGRLRKFRDANWVVKMSFVVSKMVVPLPLLLCCLFSAGIPGYVSIVAVSASLLIAVCWLLARNHVGFWLRFVLYLTVPILLSLVEAERAPWVSPRMFTFYHLCFGIIALFVLLAVKFTREAKGFRMTTMDFLIIFIAVVVPNLPDKSIRSYNLGMLAVEIITLLFGYEFLITELRGSFGALTVLTLLSFMLIGVRGGMGLLN